MDIAWIRGQMPGLKHGVYLNTAGIGMSPVSVNKAVAEGYQQLRSGSVSTSDWYAAMAEAEDELPARIAGFIGADAGEIALTMSTGEGYGMVLGGLRWQPGDEVLITNEEHPVPLQAAQGLADREGAIVKAVEIDPDKDLFLRRVEQAITPRTRLICFSHVTTDWGTRLPAREICELARARDILTLWDGCQALGQFPVDLHETGCDFYATNGYKWLLSPKGTGFLRAERRAAIFEAAAATARSRWYGPAVRDGNAGKCALPGSRRGSRFSGRHRRAAAHRRGGGTKGGIAARTPGCHSRRAESTAHAAPKPGPASSLSPSRAWTETKSLTHSGTAGKSPNGRPTSTNLPVCGFRWRSTPATQS